MAFQPGTAVLPTTQVELTISCRNLQGKDVLSKSDSMCVVYHQLFGQNNWVECFRTEVLMNCHDPDFVTKFNIAYKFEERQPLKFEIYDIDSSSSRLADHDFLGFAQCSLGQLVSSGRSQLQLVQGGGATIIIVAEELSSLKEEILLSFAGHKLDKKDTFGKSDPFLLISKVMENGQYTVVHKTEVIMNTLNPVWNPFVIPVRTLCNGDYDRSLKFTCYDYDSDGSNDLIGEFVTTLNDLSRGPSPQTVFHCINQKKKAKKKSYQHSGEIRLMCFEKRPMYSFMDFLKGGTQINCTVAIDFTGSNGNPVDPRSLHFIGNPGQLNSYEQAIQAVVSILQDYDSDKLFPVLGFGAKLPPDGRVSHEFYVNMSPDNPYVEGVNGVLQAYRTCVHQIQLYGPTNFSPVIQHVARFGEANKNGSNYFVLLILTDGIITDMQRTIETIVRSSILPLSIVIVGIGNADFSAMDALDGDSVGLQANGVVAKRDIVQFVPYNRFLSLDPHNARLLLAKEVLAEIPTQLVSYMRAAGISPNPPRQDTVTLPQDPESLGF